MTVYSDATRFATRPEARIRMERRCAITDALHAICEYRDIDHAVALLLGSVEKQARWSSNTPPPRLPYVVIASTATPVLAVLMEVPA